jgi:hypothetical protein
VKRRKLCVEAIQGEREAVLEGCAERLRLDGGCEALQGRQSWDF